MEEDIQKFEDFFIRNVWTPIDAIMQLRDVTPSVDLVVLSHFNSIPQFFASCKGIRGKDRKKLSCRSGDEYLYVTGMTSLIGLDPNRGSLREIEKAKFLYKNVRNGIAHSVLAKKLIVLTESVAVNGQALEGPLGWFYKAEETKPMEECEILGFMIYVPVFIQTIKGSVDRYIENVKAGKSELRWSRDDQL